jgi:hypothetical protein
MRIQFDQPAIAASLGSIGHRRQTLRVIQRLNRDSSRSAAFAIRARTAADA